MSGFHRNGFSYRVRFAGIWVSTETSKLWISSQLSGEGRKRRDVLRGADPQDNEVLAQRGMASMTSFKTLVNWNLIFSCRWGTDLENGAIAPLFSKYNWIRIVDSCDQYESYCHPCSPGQIRLFWCTADGKPSKRIDVLIQEGMTSQTLFFCFFSSIWWFWPRLECPFLLAASWQDVTTTDP